MFNAPKIPAVTPPPAPPTLASASVQDAGAAARAAAAAASGGLGFDSTVKTSSEGAAAPATAKQQLLGS